MSHVERLFNYSVTSTVCVVVVRACDVRACALRGQRQSIIVSNSLRWALFSVL